MTFGALGGFLRTPKNPPGYGPAVGPTAMLGYIELSDDFNKRQQCMADLQVAHSPIYDAIVRILHDMPINKPSSRKDPYVF